MRILHKKDAEVCHKAIKNYSQRIIERVDVKPGSESYKYKIETAFDLAQRELEAEFKKDLNQLKIDRKSTPRTRRQLTIEYHKKWKMVQRSFWYGRLNDYIKNHYSGRAMSAQEMAVILLNDRDNGNRKTIKKWRKVTLNDIAMIIGFSSSTPVKMVGLIKRIGGAFGLYKDAYRLYQKFQNAGVKSRMFNGLIVELATESSESQNTYNFDDSIKDLEDTDDPYFTKGF